MSLFDWVKLGAVLVMIGTGVYALWDQYRRGQTPPPPPDATAATYHCARCARTNLAANYIIAGGQANLCDHCIHALQARPPTGPERRGPCGLCGEADRSLIAEDGLPVCGDCLSICGEILAGRQRLKDLSATIEANPRDAAAWLARGDFLAVTGEFDRAIEDASRAIELAPASDLAYTCRAYALIQRERWAAALTDSDAGLRCSTEPDNQAVLHNNRARALEGLGRLEEALQAIDAALALDGTVERFRENRVRILRALGREA